MLDNNYAANDATSSVQRVADYRTEIGHAHAGGALGRYLDAPLPGLWYENLAADGRFIVEAAPATSLYHIVGAITELWTCYGAPTVVASDSK